MTNEATEYLAYTVVLAKEPKDGKHWRLVCASTMGGYSTLKETGDPSDPFYVAKGPIWFDTRDEGKAEADRRNEQELGLDEKQVTYIVTASVFPNAPRAVIAGLKERYRAVVRDGTIDHEETAR